MRSSKSGEYSNYQHCWSRFTCPNGRHAEYKIASEFAFEGCCDFLTIYAAENDQLTVIDHTFSSTERWISLGGSNISIDFRTDHSATYIGFDMELRCMPN